MEALLEMEYVWTDAFAEAMFMDAGPDFRYAPDFDCERGVTLVDYDEVMAIINAGLPEFGEQEDFDFDSIFPANVDIGLTAIP